MINQDEYIKNLKEEIENLSLEYNRSLMEDENAIGDEKLASELMKKTRELKKILNNKYKSETIKTAPLVEENKKKIKNITKKKFNIKFLERKLNINENKISNKKKIKNLLKLRKNLFIREKELDDEDIDEITSNSLGFIDIASVSIISILICIGCIIIFNILT